MVLCKKCAHAVGIATTRCPRCGWLLPWWRSRRWRPKLLRAPGVAIGKRCHRCATRTTRQRTPLWVRPFRTLSLHRCSYRTCTACGWSGLAFHARSSGERHRSRSPVEGEEFEPRLPASQRREPFYGDQEPTHQE